MSTTTSRNFSEIKELISRSKLSAWVKQKSIAVFKRIAEAEGKIHGLPPDEVHFHEVGAVDSIVDIVGAAIALELLGKPRVLASPVVEGTGWINCAHGRFPVPVPATLAILGARGIGRHPMRRAERTRHAHRRGAAGGICRRASARWKIWSPKKSASASARATTRRGQMFCARCWELVTSAE